MSTAPSSPAPRLPDSLTAADVVGVAMGHRTGHESLLAAHTIVRALVDAGVRGVCLEGAAATSPALNEWLRKGRGDPRRLLAQSQAFLRNAETCELLMWMRRHNISHPEDPLQLVHSEAPDASSSLDQIEACLADTDLRWLESTGQRIAHLGGVAHLAAGDPRTVSPGAVTGRNAAARIADRTSYACVAVTIGRATDATGHEAVPAPPRHLLEHAFENLPVPRPGTASLVSLDLARTPATDADGSVRVSREIRGWLSQPLRTRCVGPDYERDRDVEFFVQAGPVAQTISAVTHNNSVTAARRLPQHLTQTV